jgi:hypothetical protein
MVPSSIHTSKSGIPFAAICTWLSPPSPHAGGQSLDVLDVEVAFVRAVVVASSNDQQL